MMGKAKILEFNKPADFYSRTAQKMTESSNYLGALSMMRHALEKDKDNAEYTMQMAEILTGLGKYEESNSLLFDLLLHSDELRNECFFGMGCNFIGLNDFEKAQESFEKYMDEDPYGEFADEIEDFLMLFDDAMEYEDQLLEDAKEREYQKLAQEGKRLLDDGNYEQAVKVLRKIDTNNPELLFAKNNLALSYYCIKELDLAVDAAKSVLSIDKSNIHANCNMAIFLTEKGEMKKADEYLAAALRQPLEVQDDIFKAAITLCELKRHADALKYLTNFLSTSPYDEKALFFAGIASYNLKRYPDAVKYLTDITKLDPGDSVAAYYVSHVKAAMEDETLFEEVGYIYQVPPKEARNRMKYLNDCIKLPEQVFHGMWQNDKKLNDVILWGLEYGDLFIKRAVAEIVGGFGGEKAEHVLRRYILRRNQPDEVKNDIFVILKRMKAAEPYVAYFNGGVVEVKVGMADAEKGAGYKELFDLLVAKTKEHYSDNMAGKAAGLLKKYKEIGHGEAYIAEPNEFAAAITFVVLYFSEMTQEPSAVAKIYGADVDRMSGMVMDIINVIEADEEE
ncbi:MAG: tetratricopeptide repeat protein [Christensenella sp.]|uniref:tetratricopeptide repeat protein n=1 Tax=Christensenella sp. TaxID=1935934 RepID=UPI002B21848A|nr:tetratricopeptide repeat protein [Christensenella sp.]MEA5002836.1 tetratricopeptide repeat protein [Christensenella sp.]